VNTITNTNTPALPNLVPNRSLLSRSMPRGVLTHLTTMEDLRDTLARQRKAMEERDHDRSLSQLHVEFRGGRLTAQWLDRRKGLSEEMAVHKNAYSQMASDLLPARGGNFLTTQARLGEDGAKLSTASWATFARQQQNPRMFRTVKYRRDDGKVERMIRSMHSTGYAAYSNAEFVADALDAAPELGAMTVLDVSQRDTEIRIRLSATPREEFTLDKPVQMLTLWNSEVGRRSTGITAGAWKLICTNGMGSWDSKTGWTWRHYGNVERIRDGVRSAIEEAQTSASGVVEAYGKALTTEIDDMLSFLDTEMGREGLTGTQKDRAILALTDETTTQGDWLASAIDAITLAAQDEGDLLAQHDMERAASRILIRGLRTPA